MGASRRQEARHILNTGGIGSVRGEQAEAAMAEALVIRGISSDKTVTRASMPGEIGLKQLAKIGKRGGKINAQTFVRTLSFSH